MERIGVSSTVRIWKPGRNGARQAGDTAGVRTPKGRSGFERAAEASLGARE